MTEDEEVSGEFVSLYINKLHYEFAELNKKYMMEQIKNDILKTKNSKLEEAALKLKQEREASPTSFVGTTRRFQSNSALYKVLTIMDNEFAKIKNMDTQEELNYAINLIRRDAEVK